LTEACTTTTWTTWTACRTWQATRPRPARPRQSLVSGFMRLAMRLSSKNTGGEGAAAGGVGTVEPPTVEGPAVGQVCAEPWCSARAMAQDATGGATTLGSGLAPRRRSLSPSLPLLPNRTKAAPQGESPATFSDQTVPSPTSITLYSWLCRASYELELQ